MMRGEIEKLRSEKNELNRKITEKERETTTTNGETKRVLGRLIEKAEDFLNK